MASYSLVTVRCDAGPRLRVAGDQGLGVLAAGSPISQAIGCDGSAPLDAIEETEAASSSGLTYDPGGDEYTYVWKTDRGWAGTCRRLVLQLNDGTSHVASFKLG